MLSTAALPSSVPETACTSGYKHQAGQPLQKVGIVRICTKHTVLSNSTQRRKTYIVGIGNVLKIVKYSYHITLTTKLRTQGKPCTSQRGLFLVFKYNQKITAVKTQTI